MNHVDTLLHARWIAPVEPDDRVLDHHSLAMRDGRITAILPTTQARTLFSADTELELSDHVLIPGLINAHTHAAMSLMRGLADDLPLMTWLNEHIWPAEARWVGTEFVHDGTRLALAEMIRSGTTCFNDMYFFPDLSGRLAEQAGMRAVVGLIAIDFSTVWAEDANACIDKGLRVHDGLRDSPLVGTAFAPHAPYTVSDAPLERIRTLADEMDIPIHMHVHETAHEVAHGRDGIRPLQRLQGLGLLSPQLVAVHMTQLDDHEIEAYAAHGGHVVHCPESNLKLASGFCPVQRLLDAGINVALGTDGAASNNDLDMLGEMRSAALLAKAVAGDAAALPAPQALRMATLNGARALGLDGITGSLVAGKAADVTAVDLSALPTQPVYNPVSQLVYAAGREQVTDVWVEGRHLLKEGVLTTLDEAEIRNRARQWRDRIHQVDSGAPGAGEKPGNDR